MHIMVERTMGESYLCLEEENAEVTDPLEIQMLTENRIEGLLRLQIRTVDGVIGYRYPISGMISLKQHYESTEMDDSALRDLIRGIRKALQSAEEYLLCKEHILADPSYIFRDLSNGGIFLCVCPLWDVPLQEGMQKLAEFLISVTDHGCDAAIDLSYGFYRMAFAGDYRFDKLLEKEQIQKPAEAENIASKAPDKAVVVKEIPEREKNGTNGAVRVLGLAAVFALIVCFTMCLLLLKFR